jgi:hypothetical protein
MVLVDVGARELEKGDAKAVTAGRPPVVPALRPSVEAAELRRAARARQAVVASVMRRFPPKRQA